MADRYFDLNGSTAGFGTLTGAWNTSSAFWSTSSAGTAVPGTFTFTNADRAFFGAAGTTATAGTATIADGVTVTLNGITTANLAGLQTITRTTSGALAFAGTTPSLVVGSAGGLTISAPVAFNAATTINNSSTVTLSGQLTGSGTLTKSGASDLVLTGPAGAVSGAVTISTGSLRVGSFASGYPNQLETTGTTAAAVSISSGAVFYIAGGLTYNWYGNLSGTGEAYIRNTSSNGVAFLGTMSSFTGSFRLYADSTEGTNVTQRVAFTNSAQLAFGNFFFLSGAGLTTLSQTLAYTGATNLSLNAPLFIQPGSGAVTALYANDSSNGSSITNTNVVWLTNNVNATFRIAATNGPITLSNQVQEQSTGILSLSKTGNSAATLSGVCNYRGAVTVSAGTLNANSATALGADTVSSQVTVSSGAVLSLGALPAYTQRSLTFTGTGIINSAAVVLAAAGTHRFGAVTVGGAGTYLRASQTATLNNTIAASGLSLDVGAAATKTITFPQAITVQTLNVSAYAQDTGTVALNAANTISSTTGLFSNGTLSLGNSGALGASTLVFNGGTLDASTTLTVANALTVSANITFAGTAALTLSSAMALGASRTITTNGSGGALTLSGVVSGATFKLTKAGTNTLTLTNANTYSGGTDIGAGTVQAGNTQALGTSGTVTLTASGATLQTLTTGGQNGKLTVAALTNSAGGTIKIGG